MFRGPGKSRLARYHYRAQLETMMRTKSKITVVIYDGGKPAVAVTHTKNNQGLWYAEEEKAP